MKCGGHTLLEDELLGGINNVIFLHRHLQQQQDAQCDENSANPCI